MQLDEADPKGLVRESYAIEGISMGECRSIFVDWALSLPSNQVQEALRTLLEAYAAGRPDHPMSEVLSAGLAAAPRPQRRGGRAARLAEG
ncbi:hypothetical protein ORIO_05745 [Cereibacter azotoformans]|uniref:Uncharacterized protein n=2 Tax=Cereibacter TaxID=1653176 RepID=A0A2T5K955_9RHOB|nr:hypothetical protein [Cereibacter azotoformans]AXQ93324.1 hypothetical protein D0Z66_05535 [Cereibacter sphaeroides]MBO4169011.1 hypothetical protein [Cereibacter azotoformans]PTR18943.1 hypothetical protein C8J28_10691 [Cereibacter azotoformans]UIJ31640.1 hypothetical protein LV780_05530 [Cereibacter azotoformans]ULB09428.1 hypothetical protein ORIO_05745 [Cereibacter azotoformans]